MIPRRTPDPHRQRGATLLIALVFLVVLTLLAVSGMGSGVISMRLAHNSQMVREAQSAAQQQIEALLGASANFYPTAVAAATLAVDVNGDGTNDFSVARTAPRCLSTRPAPGFSYTFAASAPKDTVWDVVATATDAVFGTTVTVRQGVFMQLPVDVVCSNP